MIGGSGRSRLPLCAGLGAAGGFLCPFRKSVEIGVFTDPCSSLPIGFGWNGTFGCVWCVGFCFLISHFLFLEETHKWSKLCLGDNVALVLR